MTKPEEWRKIRTILEGAIDVDESARARWIEDACEREQVSSAVVRELIGADQASFLRPPGRDRVERLLRIARERHG